MVRLRTSRVDPAAQRRALRHRIRRLYGLLNGGDWERCYRLLDPRLRQAGRVEPGPYAKSLAAFRQRYGEVRIRHIDVNVYENVRSNKHDDRPFAYAYVFWQDAAKAFQVFRERWILDADRWYTRVAGLVAHEGTEGQQS